MIVWEVLGVKDFSVLAVWTRRYEVWVGLLSYYIFWNAPYICWITFPIMSKVGYSSCLFCFFRICGYKILPSCHFVHGVLIGSGAPPLARAAKCSCVATKSISATHSRESCCGLQGRRQMMGTVKCIGHHQPRCFPKNWRSKYHVLLVELDWVQHANLFMSLRWAARAQKVTSC